MPASKKDDRVGGYGYPHELRSCRRRRERRSSQAQEGASRSKFARQSALRSHCRAIFIAVCARHCLSLSFRRLSLPFTAVLLPAGGSKGASFWPSKEHPRFRKQYFSVTEGGDQTQPSRQCMAYSLVAPAAAPAQKLLNGKVLWHVAPRRPVPSMASSLPAPKITIGMKTTAEPPIAEPPVAEQASIKLCGNDPGGKPVSFLSPVSHCVFLRGSQRKCKFNIERVGLVD